MSKVTVVTCDMCGKTMCGAIDKDMYIVKITLPSFDEEDKEGVSTDYDICVECLKDLKNFIEDCAKKYREDKHSPITNTLMKAETLARWNT